MRTIALNGAILQMFNHGLSAAGMFFLVGVIYERTHTRNLNEFGGLFPLVPVYGGILIFTSMASLGLPGLNGFVSEFLVVRGAWPILTVYTAISMLGLLFTGAYILKGIKSCAARPAERTLGARRAQADRDQHPRNHCHGSAHGLDPLDWRLASLDPGRDQQSRGFVVLGGG